MERLEARNNFVLDNAINAYEHTADSALDRCTLDFLKELRDYRNAEEQGLLLRLPCKVGDSLYQPIHKDINEYKVIGICFDITKNEWLFEVAIQIGLEWIKTVCEFGCIGKTVFLTKEEAEQALKQMGE